MSVIVEQAGDDCILIEVRRLRNCDAHKLKNTMSGKEGERYMELEMEEFGFTQKEDNNASVSS